MSDEGSASAADRRTLTTRTGIVGAGTLVSRALGLAREAVLAALFPRAVTDAFFVAFAIPNALRQLLAEGPVQSAVVPVLAETRRAAGESGAQAFYAALRGVWLVVVVLVTGLCVAFAPELTTLFGVDRTDGAAFERTVGLTRWVFATLPFTACAALDMAVLQAHGRFAAAAFSPALMNIAMIATAAAVPPLFAAAGVDPAFALGLGAVLGSGLHMLAQWPSLHRIGYLTRPRFQPSHPEVRLVGRRILTMGVGIAVYLVNIAAARRLLSDLGEGAQSYFTWALRLCAVPQGLFVIALSTAMLPTLSSLAAERARERFAETYAFSMRLALFIAIPAAAACVGLAEPIVSAFFERGAFGADATRETARALVALAPGIVTVAAIRQLAPVFYAQGDTRTPVLGSVANLVVFLIAAAALREPWGHAGVSAAYSIANLAQALLLMWLARRRLVAQHLGAVARSAARTALASGVALGAALGVVALLPNLRAGSALGRLVPAGLGGAWFLVLFLVVSRLVRSEELATLSDAGRRALMRARGGRT